MDRANLLDCTLRDGGYINHWKFDEAAIQDIIEKLVRSGLDFVELGYLNRDGNDCASTQYRSIRQIERYLPKDRQGAIFLAMADVAQFEAKDIEPYNGNSIEGIRVVFYKHQIKDAMILAEAVSSAGYQLFMQPMVTIDYSIDEYARLSQKIAALKPYAVSIVDSFGYMLKSDFRQYFKILDNIMPIDTAIGFHSHNNMNLAFVTAQDILEYNTTRRLIIDCSLYGMGRGAGNLNTELMANYYNMTLGRKYDTNIILGLISDYIMDIYQKRQWGYTPYLFITGLYHYHPNFACYLLEEESVSVSDFFGFLQTIPDEMKTKCRKPYVIEKWMEYKEKKYGQDSGSHADKARK